jgi:hypothetical protein
MTALWDVYVLAYVTVRVVEMFFRGWGRGASFAKR